MLDLLGRDPANPVYLAHHIRNLLRQGNKEEAAKWLDDLEKIEPGSDRVKVFRAELAKEEGPGKYPMTNDQIPNVSWVPGPFRHLVLSALDGSLLYRHNPQTAHRNRPA